MNLQAEVESLLRQLQNLKLQRLSATLKDEYGDSVASPNSSPLRERSNSKIKNQKSI